MLQIALLGPLEVRRDGQRLEVPSGKTSELLARLALEAGVPVQADRLLDDLWAAAGVPARRNTLQSKVTMLRRALEDQSVVVSRDGGYTLVVDPAEVDAIAAPEHAASASRLLDLEDDRGAAALCTSTLDLYRGEVLQAAGDGEWVTPHRTRLEETRMQLVEMLLTTRLRLGDVGAAIVELEAAVATYPYQEGLWELLITALYRAGRQVDALAAYQRVRAQLADELGLDPRPELQQLEQRILVQDASLGVSGRPVGAPSGGNLPSMSAELVGREGDVASLVDLLAKERLVEVVGPGGVGKTAVAVAVARELSLSTDTRTGGIWLARLETAATANDVVDVLIAAMHGPGGEEALFERIKGTSDLVVFDNCEHVREAVAALAVRLLDAAPGLRILCTSQIPLDVEAEVVHELAPLRLTDAVELFTRRAAAQRRRHISSGDESSVVELCRSLDGLPLAIELAAARTRTLPVQEITRRLDDRFHMLSDPTSRRPERRRSLRSTIRWSYDLLFPDDQRGLWALATFAGGAPLPAVESVLEALEVPASAAVDVVGRLENRSLVIVDEAEAPTPSTRFRLLDSIRAFSLEAMAEAGMSEAALAAHAAWYGEAADASTPGVRSSHQAEHLAFARAERANLDAALVWSAAHDPLLALRIVNGFGWAWVVLGDTRGAERISTALDAAGDTAPVHGRASALLLAAWIEASTGHLALAREHISSATTLADTIHDDELQGRCSYYLAYVVSHHGEFRRAMELTDRSRAIYDGLDRPWDQLANWLFAGRAAISAGDQERSVEAADQINRWLPKVEDPWLHVRAEALLGELARIQHRFEDAVLHIDRAAQTSRRLGFLQTEAYQVSSLGRAQCQAGDYDAGRASLERAIDKAQATGDVRLVALVRVHLGRVLRAVGDVARSRAVLESADAWHRASGGGEQAALGECLLAALDAAEGAPDAEERLRVISDAAARSGDAPVEVLALDALARIAVVRGDLVSARTMSEAADRRMADASHFITDRDRTDAHWVRQVS